MASVAMSSSLAARHAVAPNAALVSAQRRSASESSGRRLAARRGPARVRAQDDGIPDTAGPGGFSGSRLIVPGMEGFDPSYGDPSRNRPPSIPSPSNPGGGRPAGPPGSVGSNMPGQFPGGYEAPPKPGSERKAGEAFAPFRPPSEYLDQGDFAAEDDNMSLLRLRQRAGNWFDLAPLFPKLMRSGMTPDDIFDETGIEPREQSLWATWVASRGSSSRTPLSRREAVVLRSGVERGEPVAHPIPQQRLAGVVRRVRGGQRIQPGPDQGAGQVRGDSQRARFAGEGFREGPASAWRLRCGATYRRCSAIRASRR